MADRPISQLSPILPTAIAQDDSFVLEHINEARRLKGGDLLQWLLAQFDGHGGILRIDGPVSTGLTDRYTVVYTDNTMWDFTLTRVPGPPPSINAVSIQYGVSENLQTRPSSWSPTMPTVSSGHVLWEQYTITYAVTGDTFVLELPARQGLDGTGTVNSVDGFSPDVTHNVSLPKASYPSTSPAGDCGYAITSQGVYDALYDESVFIVNVGELTGSEPSKTIYSGQITADMECIEVKIGNPSAFASDLSCVTANGSITVEATMRQDSSSTVVLYLKKVKPIVVNT